MMTKKYNPDIHHRRSIRLTGHDYSQSGLYFITLCTVDRTCMFGNVVEGKMQLNDIGQLVEHHQYPSQRCAFAELYCYAQSFSCNYRNP